MEQQGSGQELTQAEVAAWTAGWEEIQERIGPRFARSEQRQRVRRYVGGLLSPVERKNGWQVAEQAGEARSYGMQPVLAGRNGTRMRCATICAPISWSSWAIQLGNPRAVLVIDETGCLKQGSKSVGVKRQYSGTAGRIENCQIGVFLPYAAPQGHVLLDRELYLPREWADDAERRQEAGVPQEVMLWSNKVSPQPESRRRLLSGSPEEAHGTTKSVIACAQARPGRRPLRPDDKVYSTTPVRFATKPQLARRMLERAFVAGVPAAWVTGDSISGGDRRLRVWLEQQEQQEQPFVLAVTSAEPLFAFLAGHFGQPRADLLAAHIPT